jgi:tRNA(Ile)-lysidine synthase
VDVAGASVAARGERLLISTSAVLPARAGEMTLEVDVRASLDGRVLESGRGDVAVVQAAAIEWPLAVRRRRPGDRFRPLGAPGTRKLKDVLIDRKIPRAERDHLAVVVDAAGHIVWVARVAIAHDCRVTKPAAKVVILTVRTT